MPSETSVSSSPGEEAAGGRSATMRTLGLYGFAVLAFLVGSVALARTFASSHPPVQRVVVIPAGTAARVAAGEQVDLIPADLTFKLDDRLVVVNQDSATHRIGPFTVAPGQRLEERLSKAASFTGFCSLHPSGNVDIRISGT